MSDKIDEIRARHSRENRWRYSPSPQMHDDRATLLAEVDRQRAEIERLRAALREAASLSSGCPWCKDVVPPLCCKALEGKP